MSLLFDPKTRTGIGQVAMRDGSEAFIIIDVKNLGQEAMVVNTSGPRLLLLDTKLTCDRRMEILNYVMEKYAA